MLTDREISILRLMAEGYSNRQIATELYVSEGTIKDQLQKIMDKLGASNRVSALYIATKERLIEGLPPRVSNMNDTMPAFAAAVSRARIAFGDFAQLQQIGAELAAQDVPLADVLAALPADDHTPRTASALAAGYAEAQVTRAARDTDTLQAELERRRAELSALHHVNAMATSSLDETTVLNKVVNAVAQVMHVDVCSIYLLHAASHLVLRATYGLSPHAVDRASLAIGEGVRDGPRTGAYRGGGGSLVRCAQHLPKPPRKIIIPCSRRRFARRAVNRCWA